MKFSSEVRPLCEAVKAVATVKVSAKNSIPILTNIHVVASSETNKVKMRGTDLDAEITISAQADVESSGEICVDANLFKSILAKLQDNALVVFELDKKNGTVALKCGRSRFKLATLPPEDFPSFKMHDGNHRFVMPGADLNKLLETTEFAISTEATRYYLNGTYLHINGKMLRATATDGHRLACADVAIPSGVEGMPGVIIPRQTVEYLRKSLNGADVEVAVSQATIEVTIGDTTLKSKLIDGEFPDYHRVIPIGNDKTATVSSEAFIEAADRVTTISSEKSRSVRLDFESGSLKFSVVNPDIGSSEEEVDAEWDEKEPLSIRFNGRYLGDIFKQINAESVEIKLADPSSPTLFKPVNDDSRFFVLMPTRI